MPLFFLDGLKQLLSNGLIHFVNIFFSIILGKLSTGDQCGLYFISIVIDVTLGTFISFLLLYMFDKLVSYQCSKVPRADPETEVRQLLQEGLPEREDRLQNRLPLLHAADFDLVVDRDVGRPGVTR